MKQGFLGVLLLAYLLFVGTVDLGFAQIVQTGVRMLHYPIGADSHFLIRVVQPDNDDHYWYYRSRPVRIKDQRKGEWISSYVHYNWQSDRMHYEVFAWGKLAGKGDALKGRFQIASADKLRDLAVDEISENQLARLICAGAETGRVLTGIPAYKNWAQLSQNELQRWQPLLAYLGSDNSRRFTRGGGRDLDLYSVFTGISAIRETLQTDVELGGRAPQIDRFCAANLRVIQGAVEMYNMDHATMMDELDIDKLVEGGYLKTKVVCNSGSDYYGRNLTKNGMIRCPVHGDIENPTPDVDQKAAPGKLVEVSTLEGPKAPSHPWRKMIKNPQLALPQAYSLVPADCAFAHFPSYTAFRKAFDFFDEWAAAFGTLSGGESGNSNFSIEKRIKDQLLLKTDMLTKLFADLALSDIVFVAEDPFIFEGSAIAVLLKISNETLLREKLAMTAAEFCRENPSIKENTTVIGGRQVQAFTSPDFRFRSYRITEKGHQIICNSPVLLAKIIAVIDGKAPPLTEYLDLHYFYEHIEKNFAGPGRIFTFLSDAFIRKLIGPAYKIATKRRLECMRNTLLQSHEILVSGKLGAGAECPEGGAYEYVDGEIRCPHHRSFGRLTPVSELLPTGVTSEEAGSYKQFVAQYNQYFSQFFDPIGFVFTTEPEFRGRLLIMPLVENSVYSELQKNVRRQAMKPAPQLKTCIMKFGANLKAETLPLPGHWHNPQLSRRTELFRKWFTGCLWAQIADHPLLFQWDSNLMARGILGSLSGGRAADFAALSPFLMSFFSPVMVALELTDAEHYQSIIDFLQIEIDSARSMRGGFVSPEFSLSRLEENGVEMYVLSFDLFAIRKTYYLTCRDGFLLVASKKELFYELESPEEREKGAFTGNFNLVLYPKNIRLMRPDLLEIRARSQREACLENLKNIHFVSSFRPDQFKSSYQIVYGAAPNCPAGGKYSNELPVSCTVHGTISGGALKPVPDFFKGVGAISIQSFIDPEGFQSEVRFFPE